MTVAGAPNLARIPAGEFLMGAQGTDPAGPHYDAKAEPDEQPVQRVRLDAFFLAKHETTQAQWSRSTRGGAPSLYHPAHPDLIRIGKPATRLHPVERVSWRDAEEVARRQGFVLPTEAQWEYACRAGSDAVFAFGDDPAGLQGRANTPDATAREHAIGFPEYNAWADGYVVHGPVGHFAANAFGLYDMNGNVAEWCRDGEQPYSVACRAHDGLREPSRHHSATLPFMSYNPKALAAK